MTKQEIRLKVAEAIQDDVNKGVVRIDSAFMREIDVRPGDIVEIEGGGATVGVVDRAYPGDIGLNIIRMDSLIRKNAKTTIGELVQIRKAEVKEAKKVTIAPAREGIVVKASPIIFKQGLLGRALVKGDIISLGGARRRRQGPPGSPFFDEVFNMLEDNTLMGFGFGDIKFIVVDTNPKQAVIITEETEIKLNPEAAEAKEDSSLEVAYEDVGGLHEEIRKIREMVELPLRHPEIFERLGIEPPKGVLLHGPPGTGKTLLAKAVASETNCHFSSINGPEIMSKYYGQSEENLRKKFEEAEKNAPSILFIDEIDAIASKREETRGEVERRVVAQLLALMDGLKSRGRVVVIAATNVPNILDPALRRPGRFDREVEIGVPNKIGRMQILKIHTRNMPLSTKEVYQEVLFRKTDQMISESAEKSILRMKEQEEKVAKLKDQTPSSEEHREMAEQRLRTAEARLAEVKIESTEMTDLLERKSQDPERFKELIRILKQVCDVKQPSSNDELKQELFKLVGTRDKMLDIAVKHGFFSLETIRQVKLEGAQMDLQTIAANTHGFVGADVASLAKEAAMIALRRILPDIKYDKDEPISKEVLERLLTTKEDFIEALKVVRPSALREVLVEVPNVRWDTIGGLEKVKQEVKEAVEWPLKYPEAFKRLGISPPKGILLYGPPGTGKTLIAKAIATESEANFISVKGPQLLSMWVGESEKGVRKVFERARQTAPAVIFFDEIDALAPRRSAAADSHVTERIVNQLLTEIDGVQSLQNVVIIGATNRPDILDTALLRPGRFDRIILTPAPDATSRKQIFTVHMKDMPLDEDVDVNELAQKAEGYAGADIEAVCREAAIFSLREIIDAEKNQETEGRVSTYDKPIVNRKHFEMAMDKVSPSITKEIEKLYEDLQSQFKKARAKEMEVEKPVYFG